MNIFGHIKVKKNTILEESQILDRLVLQNDTIDNPIAKLSSFKNEVEELIIKEEIKLRPTNKMNMD